MQSEKGDSIAQMSAFLFPPSVFPPSLTAGGVPKVSTHTVPNIIANTDSLQKGTPNGTIPKSGHAGSHSPPQPTKVVTKGRRPKSMGPGNVAGVGTPPGMFPDRPMCRSCGKYFMSRQQLNQHMLVHTDIRKYKCTYCDRAFKQPSHLHQHHRIHTGDKPYRCPIAGCSRAFPQQSNLNHHLRNHDKPAPPPENTCTLCMREYASETVLRSHITKIHLCDPDTILGIKSTKSSKPAPSKPNNKILRSEDELSVHVKSDSNTTNKEHSINDLLISEKLMYEVKKNYIGQFEYAHTALRKINETYTKANGVVVASVCQNDENTLDEKGYEQSDFSNDINYHYTLNGADDDMLKHFVVRSVASAMSSPNSSTTEGASPHFTSTIVDSQFNGQTIIGSGEKRKLPCKEDILDIEAHEKDSSSNSSSEIYSKDSVSAGSSLPAVEVTYSTGRSRKRKAFQPQRIVHNVEFD